MTQNAEPITVRNRLTAYMAAKACHDAGLSLCEGLSRGLYVLESGWGWTPSDVLAVAQDNRLPVAYMTDPRTAPTVRITR